MDSNDRALVVELGWKRASQLSGELEKAQERVRFLEGLLLKMRDHVPDELASVGDYSCIDVQQDAENVVGKRPEKDMNEEGGT